MPDLDHVTAHELRAELDETHLALRQAMDELKVWSGDPDRDDAEMTPVPRELWDRWLELAAPPFQPTTA